MSFITCLSSFLIKSLSNSLPGSTHTEPWLPDVQLVIQIEACVGSTMTSEFTTVILDVSLILILPLTQHYVSLTVLCVQGKPPKPPADCKAGPAFQVLNILVIIKILLK